MSERVYTEAECKLFRRTARAFVRALLKIKAGDLEAGAESYFYASAYSFHLMNGPSHDRRHGGLSCDSAHQERVVESVDFGSTGLGCGDW